MRAATTKPAAAARWTTAVAVGALLATLAACEPAVPDGRDLGVAVGAVPDELSIGAAEQVSVSVTNHGDVGSDGTRLGLLAPVSLEIAAVAGATACDIAGDFGTHRLVVCDLGELDPGATASVDLTLTGSAVAADAELAVVATSAAAEPDVDPHPNQLTRSLGVVLGPVDLHVVADRDPGASLVGEPFDSISTVANRGAATASGVVVTQAFPTDVAVAGATFERADGGATGACEVSPGLVSCDTGGNLLAPLAAPGGRWLLTVTLVPADGSYFFIDHDAVSPHPEPVDAWPNEARVTTGAELRLLWIDEVGTVPVGTEFDVAVGFDGVFAQWASFSLPTGLELVSATSGGTTHPCGANSCTASPWYFAAPATFRFRATAPTDPTTVGVYLSSEAGAAGGSFAVQVVDPAVGSDLHPDLDPPTHAVVGQPLAVTGVVRNSGGTDHDDVTVEIAADGIEIDQVLWGEALVPCDDLGPSFRCDLGALPAHQVAPLRLALSPAAPGDASVTVDVSSATPQDEPDPVADQQVMSFAVEAATVDLGVTLSPNLDPAALGTPLQITAEVTNHGTVTASGAELELASPALPFTGAQVASTTPPSWGGCATTAPAVSCDLGDLGPGGSVTIVVTLDVPTDDGGTVTASVVSGHAEPDPDAHPNEVDHVVTVDPPTSDLEVLLTPPSSVVSGEDRTWGVHTVNHGPAATSATVVVTFPAGFEVSSYPQDPSSVDCSLAGTVVTCQLATMHGSRGYHSAYITTRPSTPEVGAEVHAIATSPLPDPGPEVHEVVHTFDVLAREVDLGVSTTESAEVVAGIVDPFTVSVVNAGPAIARDVVLTATFPASVQVVGTVASWSGVSCTSAGQTVTCTLPDLHPGSGPLLHFHVAHLTVGDPADFTFSVTSSIPEATAATLPNTLEATRTATPGDARLRVWVEDVRGNQLPATVRVYRPTDGFVASYTASLAPGGGWYEIPALPPGEYKVQVSRAGFVTEWWNDQATRASATTLVAAGLSERFDLHVVLAQAP